MLALGIETSCDETAAAVVDGDRRIRSSVVASQLEHHRPFGGVVPEVAARAHLELLQGLVHRALDAGATTVVAVGGDGTWGKCAAAMAEAGADARISRTCGRSRPSHRPRSPLLV